MTMPSKIWATHFTGSLTEGKFSIYNMNAYGPHTEYIRADLAEELARAASVSLAYYFEESREYIDGMTELLAELTAYRALTH